MPRKVFKTDEEEFDYRLHCFIKGHKYGCSEAKLRFIALMLFAHRKGIKLPTSIGIDGIELASTQSLDPEELAAAPGPVKNFMEELEGRA